MVEVGAPLKAGDLVFERRARADGGGRAGRRDPGRDRRAAVRSRRFSAPSSPHVERRRNVWKCGARTGIRLPQHALVAGLAASTCDFCDPCLCAPRVAAPAQVLPCGYLPKRLFRSSPSKRRRTSKRFPPVLAGQRIRTGGKEGALRGPAELLGSLLEQPPEQMPSHSTDGYVEAWAQFVPASATDPPVRGRRLTASRFVARALGGTCSAPDSATSRR